MHNKGWWNELPMNTNQAKHEKPLPNARAIRRSCSKELYRTIKKLKAYIPASRVKEAEELYIKKVMLNLPWIAENGSNRRVLADWFGENVAPDIAALWELEPQAVSRAFRDSFGGRA